MLLDKSLFRRRRRSRTPNGKDGVIAARGGPEAIREFHKKGGIFDDTRDDSEHNYGTAAMNAVRGGPESIRAYAKAGGHFNNLIYACAEPGVYNYNVGMLATTYGSDTMRAFVECGGDFESPSVPVYSITKSAADWVLRVDQGSPVRIEDVVTFIELGGQLSTQKQKLRLLGLFPEIVCAVTDHLIMHLVKASPEERTDYPAFASRKWVELFRATL